jgi:hypothetical protein
MGKEVQKVNSERQRQRYSKEFKLAAVKLLQAGNKPATQLALELGIRRNLLYKWCPVRTVREPFLAFKAPFFAGFGALLVAILALIMPIACAFSG